ncbi:ribosome hibernation-promoting factor, HPF/YfiA family [Commensalibacter oyaizuii]|uniref:Ribosome hibernation promoting factor n=1 Tax=Commensalibacter oyaizuii TaxID=3043873 RepID=A0ABT6PZ14_9PROT|nr:ribosome-associated translation inhibitor RaiA [Commensalibacter sp. TBRC 16381]MDI2090095.1 ribosome-associated translation inhibitor RaiA [Commensalibacter sp. TBRC 16381]
MQTSIFGKKIEIPDWFRQKIEEILEKTTQKYFDNVISAAVTFNKNPSGYTCQIHVHVSQDLSIRSEGSSSEVQNAFEDAINHMTKRLRRYKGRLLRRRVRPADHRLIEGRQYIIQPEDQNELSQQEQVERAISERIIAEKATEIDTLTVYEAIMHLDLSERPVLMFKNSDNQRVSVIYKQQDGKIVWLDSGINS